MRVNERPDQPPPTQAATDFRVVKDIDTVVVFYEVILPCGPIHEDNSHSQNQADQEFFARLTNSHLRHDSVLIGIFSKTLSRRTVAFLLVERQPAAQGGNPKTVSHPFHGRAR